MNLDLSPTPIEREPITATLTGQIDTLSNRRGKYKLVIIGESRDLDELVQTSRMQVSNTIEIRLTEKPDSPQPAKR